MFALVALPPATIGIYGVHVVRGERARNGVRSAVGAKPRRALARVGQMLGLAALGPALGIAVLRLAGRAHEGRQIGARLDDPVAIGLAARRAGGRPAAGGGGPRGGASRLDPIEALRYEWLSAPGGRSRAG